jgi:hypothetical protein
MSLLKALKKISNILGVNSLTTMKTFGVFLIWKTGILMKRKPGYKRDFMKKWNIRYLCLRRVRTISLRFVLMLLMIKRVSQSLLGILEA